MILYINTTKFVQTIKVMRNKTGGYRVRAICIAVFSTVCFCICFMMALYFALGYYLFTFSLDATFASVSHVPKNVIIEMPKPVQKTEWFKSIDKEDIYIESYDGYKLHAYKIKNTNSNRWAICVHGYRDKGEGMSLYAYHYYNQGFNVLLPDLKGHGKSEGKYVGMGYNDRKDLISWIDQIIAEDSSAQIVLHGVSMGAATVMMTCGESLPENVMVAVEDCGYTSVYDQYSYVAENFIDIPMKNFALSALDTYSKLKLKTNLKEMNALEQLKKSKTPMLFIHGSKDTFIPLSMMQELYDSNNEIIKEKYVVEGASHAYSASFDTDNYFKKVFEFVYKFLN